MEAGQLATQYKNMLKQHVVDLIQRNMERMNEDIVWATIGNVTKTNLFVVEALSESEFQLKCPVGFSRKSVYNRQRKKALVLYKTQNGVYEVITDANGKAFLPSALNKTLVPELLDQLNEGCKTGYSKETVDGLRQFLLYKPEDRVGNAMYKVLSDTLPMYRFKEMYKVLMAMRANPVALVMDDFNKLRYIQVQDNVLVPIEPDFPPMEHRLPMVPLHSVELPDASTVQRFFKRLAKRVQGYSVYDEAVTGSMVLLENTLMTPVKHRDDKEANNEDVSQSYTSRYLFQKETYERMRFEFARFLAVNSDAKDAVTTERNRSALQEIVLEIIQVLTTDEPHKDFESVLLSPVGEVYKVPVVRLECFNRELDGMRAGLQDIHCSNNKLYVSDVDFVTKKPGVLKQFASRLTEELLRITNKRYELLENKVSDIAATSLNKTVISQTQAKGLLEQVQGLYYRSPLAKAATTMLQERMYINLQLPPVFKNLQALDPELRVVVPRQKDFTTMHLVEAAFQGAAKQNQSVRFSDAVISLLKAGKLQRENVKLHRYQGPDPSEVEMVALLRDNRLVLSEEVVRALALYYSVTVMVTGYIGSHIFCEVLNRNKQNKVVMLYLDRPDFLSLNVFRPIVMVNESNAEQSVFSYSEVALIMSWCESLEF